MTTRDHGGNLDAARARFGQGDWIDLSTGINRRPWPVPPVSATAWQALPTAGAEAHLMQVAAQWFGCPPGRVLAVPGASAAIQALPRLVPGRRAAVLTPSYNEHAAALAQAGWQVTPATDPQDMAGADLAVIVNPNNPDGRDWTPAVLSALAGRVGWLLVDESFADPRPDLSLAPALPDNAIVLRSFGKFWGLAGLRLGFVLAAPGPLARLREALGPWSVSGPALEIAAAAMADRGWAGDAVTYHAEAAPRLDGMALRAGWQVVGGTHLFRLYATPDASAAQAHLAQARIWTRIFPYAPRWLRMGIPGSRSEWDRLARRVAPVTRLAALLLALMPAPALADAALVVLDRTQLPFDLGPGHPDNAPSRAANAPHAAWNSAGNTANSGDVAGNRPTDPANQRRVILTGDGQVVGYYAPNPGGVLNLFDLDGTRIAYRPAGGTHSLFTVDGAWCGTVDGLRDGGMVLAVTPDCVRRFLR